MMFNLVGNWVINKFCPKCGWKMRMYTGGWFCTNLECGHSDGV
jgi:NADH pyrophosphatase NudC (nudix superfamily)